MRILCLDFDGVLHSYSSGWRGADVISDPPVPGALDFIRMAGERFQVAIFSSRSNQPGGVEAMKNWLAEHGMEPFEIEAIDFPIVKPPAFLTIDDRALTFTGLFPAMEQLQSFKPWNHHVGSDGS